MRQIDNMTPQEIDTLALKGMTAPRTAGEHNKAQHSPLPWEVSAWMTPDNKNGGWTLQTSDIFPIAMGAEKESKIQIADVHDYADAKLIVASVNHADKLAEALRRFTDAYRLQSEHDLECAEAIAREALAAWEAAQ